MAIATFKDLCIDAIEPRALGRFWAGALGLTYVALEDKDVRLDGPTRQHSIWVNRVPEPVTAKQRVHLDVDAGSVDEVLALGATPVDLESFRWKVLKDPEGGELCVFEREKVASYKLYEIVVDARDGQTIASWWAEVFGATVQDHEGDDVFSWFEDAPGMPFEMVFGNVPEPKTVKNRIHWDVDTDDVRLLLDAGATVLREPDQQISWHILADPEGNEFCAFTPRG